MSLPKSNGRDVCPRRDNKKPRAQARSQMISRDDTMGDMDVVVGVTDRLSHVSSFPSGRITILLFPTQRNTNKNIMAVCVCVRLVSVPFRTLRFLWCCKSINNAKLETNNAMPRIPNRLQGSHVGDVRRHRKSRLWQWQFQSELSGTTFKNKKLSFVFSLCFPSMWWKVSHGQIPVICNLISLRLCVCIFKKPVRA